MNLASYLRGNDGTEAEMTGRETDVDTQAIIGRDGG